jgi:putative membrane protein
VQNDKAWLTIIGAISIVVIALVALLLFNSQHINSYDSRIYMLPKLNAFLNSSVSILLVAGYYFIRVKKNIKLHRACMLSAFIFSAVFLLSYVTYHSSAPETKFGGAGLIKGIYLFLLLTHIVLASIIVPLALLTLYRIWKNQVEKHKKIARWTFPIWLYVSITGVIVYLMISPYYPV